VTDEHVRANEDALEVLYPERLHEANPFPIVLVEHFREASPIEVIVMLTISFLRSADGHFCRGHHWVGLPGGKFWFGWDFWNSPSVR